MNRRRRALAGLEEDIGEHLDRETRDNIERGMSPGEARAAALRKFGNVAMVEEETRAVWRRPWVDQLLQDLGFAFRVLRRDRAFTAVAILTLAVGIGLNTAVLQRGELSALAAGSTTPILNGWFGSANTTHSPTTIW